MIQRNFNKNKLFSFVINKNIYNDNIIQYIKKNFKYYIIFKSNEYGNDIQPTLQAVHYIIKYFPSIEYIYKIHTKTDNIYRNSGVHYLLDKNVEELKELLNSVNSNCVGYPDYYLTIKDEFYNFKYRKIYNKYINLNNKFVINTIFFCSINVFKEIFEFIKNNNTLSFFNNNMYDTNQININSPNHLLERLFGCIIVNNINYSNNFL